MNEIKKERESRVETFSKRHSGAINLIAMISGVLGILLSTCTVIFGVMIHNKVSVIKVENSHIYNGNINQTIGDHSPATIIIYAPQSNSTEKVSVSVVPTQASHTTNSTTEIDTTVDFTPVPNVIGMNIEEAIDVLIQAGFESIRYPAISQYPQTVFYVFQQSVDPGQPIGSNKTIELNCLTVKPGEQVVVPNLIEKEQHEAASIIVKSGLQFTVFTYEDVNSNNNNNYYVINQSIPAGSIVDAGTIITLELSTKVP